MEEIALHILDIIQNSIAAGADEIIVTIASAAEPELLIIDIVDNGSGMDSKTVEMSQDPFGTTRTTRKVGLGIPLFRAGAEAAGGYLKIISDKGKGTKVTAAYKLNHIDRPPLGNIAEIIALQAACNIDTDFILQLKNGFDEYEFSTKELKALIAPVPISETEIVQWMKAQIGEQLKIIHGGVL